MGPDSSTLRLDANIKWLFTELPFERRFDAAAKANFDGVEYASPYEYSPTTLRKLLDDAGLKQVLINTPAGAVGSPTQSGAACIPDAVVEFRAGVCQAIEYAEILDADVIHVMAGICPPAVSMDYAFSTYVANMAWAREEVRSTGITLAIEVLNQRDAPGFVLTSIEQAAAVVQALEGDHIGLLFDLYHCQVSQGDLTVRLRSLMPFIAHIQIADVPNRNEPGTGEIGWEHVLQEIRMLKYPGWIGCEYRPVASTLEGLSWRERFLRPVAGAWSHS
jgi:hydroxypyruvate isomerase